jgi:serine/threonine protein kinase
MELCNGGDLDNLKKVRGGYLPEIEARIILQQMVKGLAVIKDKNVIHRDLKLANILVHFKEFKDSENDYLLQRAHGKHTDFKLETYLKTCDLVGPKEEECPVSIKIADLGFARKLEDGGLATTYCGTPLQMAP